jgi:hypothetical protein
MVDHLTSQLRTPDLDSFPVGIPVPITFTVITHTKPLERGKKSRNPFSSHSHSHSPSSSEDELSFPAPPKTPETIKFVLFQHVKLKAQSLHQNFDVKLGAVGGFGDPGDKALSVPTSPVRTTVLEPSWIPEEGDEKKGRWRQETRFETTLTFNCPPNVSLEPSIRMMVRLLSVSSCSFNSLYVVDRTSYGSRCLSVVPGMTSTGISRLSSTRASRLWV